MTVPKPRSIARHLNRLYWQTTTQTEFNDNGIDIFDADWDNLIILDACRADYYQEHAERRNMLGRYQTRTSKASMTERWTKANFRNRDLQDTVYLSANGMARPDEIGAQLHEYVPVWLESHRGGGHERVSHPERLTERTIEAIEQYPEKRLLVHYVQPHVPFMGESGDRFKIDADLPELARNHSLSDIKKAYRENLDLVLTEVDRLLKSLPGKTVVSADHGQLLGERLWPIPIREVGHPREIYIEELVQVPWDVHENGPRKVINKGKQRAAVEYNEDELSEHLQSLGYA